MIKNKKFGVHNKLSFEGVKIKPVYAKLINDVMYEMTQLDGAYKYDSSGISTEFTIYPESITFGDDPNEFNTCLQTYKEIFEHVIQHYPECLA